jgi:hypothetical protein
VERERRLLSHLIRTLDEGRHPALQALRALLDQDPPDPERLRALSHLLMLLPADPLAGPGEAMPGRIGAQLVGMALDRWAGDLPPGALRQPLTEILRALRFHGPALAEALAALLGAFWLRGEDPAWALEMARRAEQLLQDRQRAAALQGVTSPELAEWLRWAQEIIGEILRDRHLAAAEPPREEAPERTPAEPIPTPKGLLRPARLALLSLVLLPDTHPQAGDLQFLDPQTAERLSDSAEVQIERLRVGEQVYRVYVEADMDRVVVARREELIVLRVEGGQLLAILLSFISAMKLSDWARQQGISDITAWRWFRAEKLPVPARPLPAGTILVEAPHPEGITVRYDRVSSADQKEDLERQVQRLQAFAQEQGWTEVKAVTEIGSGLNGSGSDCRGASRSAGPVRI